MHEFNAVIVRLEDALASHSLDIPPANLSILQFLADKGVVIGLSSRSSAKKLLAYLKKKNIDSLFSFLIASQGAEYVNLRSNPVHKVNLGEIDRQTLLDAAKVVSSLPVSMGVWNGRGFTFDKPGLFALSYSLRRYKSFSSRGFSSLDPSLKIRKILLTGSRSLLERFPRRFEGIPLQWIPWSGNIVDLIPESVDPLHALSRGAADFQLDPASILSFSSSPIDIRLMDHTYAIAMKNSPETVRRHADRIAKYNASQNGIAYMINMMMMEKACVFKNPHPQEAQ